MRFARATVPQSLALHTVFMNSHLKVDPHEPFSHFQLKLRVVEHRTKPQYGPGENPGTNRSADMP